MNARDIIQIVFGTLLLLFVVLGGLWFALMYLPAHNNENSLEVKTECAEEDLTGVCGIRKALRISR